ncbi:MAG: peptidyl-prolyl cis-trans isomerase [Verrucomicrobiae bacterium]|nr:peptidyl-prolyl cis-trans isomerase [Verrucomicrobiae bacterium]
MGKRLLTAPLVALVLFASSGAVADTVDGIAAVVNDRLITFSDVRELATPAIQNAYRLYTGEERDRKVQQAGVDALNTLVERALILQEYKEKGYHIPDHVFEGRVREIIEEQYGGDKNALIRTLQARGLTFDQWKEKFVREPFIVQALRQKEVSADVVISPAAIEQYYNENKAKFSLPYQVRLRMIVIKKEAGVNPNEARELAQNLWEKLEAGADFAALANVYSSSGQKNLGGDWGWVDKESGLRKELADVAFALQAGQHSKVIETEDGCYIVQVDEVRPARARTLAEVRGEIEKTLAQEKRSERQRQWMERLKKKAYIRYF